MVVADIDSPGPQRKRMRLSLKASRQTAKTEILSEQKESGSDSQGKGDQSDDRCGSPLRDVSLSAGGDHELSPTSENQVVPAITSLENLGNTCFLNSIIQVLRYTPGFREGLEGLYSAVVQAEKLQREENASGEEANSDCNDRTASWEFVKYLQRLFRLMNSRESRHAQIATSDVMSMAVRPERVLNQIRTLNPMFEGNLQHDAQELLKCMLCYLQDAEKEIHKFMAFLPPRIDIDHKKTINPIMHKFLHGKAFPVKSSSEQTDHSLPTAPVPSPVKGNNSLEPDILDQIEQSEGAKTAAQAETSTPLMNGPLNSSQHSASITRKMDQHGEIIETQTDTNNISPTDTSDNNRKAPKLDVKPARKSTGRKRNSVPTKNLNNGSNSISSIDILSADSCQPVSKKRGRPKRVRDESVADDIKSDVSRSDMVQPSLLNLWKKRESSCKRLGMRGAAVIRNNSEIGATNEISPGEHCSKKESLFEYGHKTAEDKKCLSAGKIESPLKHPMIKLEKCDHICSSPKKSVNADYATKHLSPVKQCDKRNSESVNDMHCRNIFGIFDKIKTENKKEQDSSEIISKPHSSPENVSSLAAKIISHINESKPNKLFESPKKMNNLSEAEKDSKSPSHNLKMVNGLDSQLSPSPRRKKRRNFVEQLFQGTMMLRTRCLECESSREKQEEFFDVSVPVRREKNSHDDDESEDEDDSSLSKLMMAFMEAERLRDENKYYCDKCIRYVEAERSLHFDTLPDILTLHLKRFTATSGFFGYVSKINDHVTIPLYLPCLLESCGTPCQQTNHRYKLYALVTHAGMTLSSGHYLSYVHVQPKSTSIKQLFSPNLFKKMKLDNQWKKDSDDPEVTFKTAPLQTPNGEMSPAAEDQSCMDQWVECDDESIRMYSEEEFAGILSGEEGSLLGSPYVLFYHRIF